MKSQFRRLCAAQCLSSVTWGLLPFMISETYLSVLSRYSHLDSQQITGKCIQHYYLLNIIYRSLSLK